MQEPRTFWFKLNLFQFQYFLVVLFDLLFHSFDVSSCLEGFFYLSVDGANANTFVILLLLNLKLKLRYFYFILFQFNIRHSFKESHPGNEVNVGFTFQLLFVWIAIVNIYKSGFTL